MPRELDLLTVLSLAHHNPSKWVVIDYFPLLNGGTDGKFAHRVHAACAASAKENHITPVSIYRYDWWRFYFGGPCRECGALRYTP